MSSKTISRIFNRSRENDSISFTDGLNANESSYPSFELNENENYKNDEILDSDDRSTRLLHKSAEINNSFVRQSKRNRLDYFDNDHKYLGEIISIDKEQSVFTAKLKTHDDAYSREIEFSFDEIIPEEISHIEIGKKIIYVCGRQFINGTMYNISKLYFRKEMQWTQRDIDKKKAEALKLFAMMSDENSNE